MKNCYLCLQGFIRALTAKITEIKGKEEKGGGGEKEEGGGGKA